MPVKKPESLDAPIESHAQYIFEQHYLQPFPGPASVAKANLYQLPVKRISHGVQHAARVAMLVRILAHFLKQTQPELTDELNEQRIRLLEITALFHDAARENDREADRWERASSDLCRQYLDDIGEEGQFATIICQPEENGLLGNILQSADYLDIMRCKKTFDITKMSLWHAFSKEQQKHFLPLIEEHLSFIAEQHDLKHSLTFTISGRTFSHASTRDAQRPELKQAYEQAENAYLKVVNDLKGKKNLSGLYENQPGMVQPDIDLPVKNGKAESDDTSLPITPGPTVFKLKPWLVASEVSRENKSVTHYYCYSTREKAERQLEIIKDLLDTAYPDLASRLIVKQTNYLPTYLFWLSDEEHQALKTLQGHPRLVKSVRWDKLCFINDFILGATPSEQTHHRQALRRGLHKRFTTFFEGAYPYRQKPSPYPEENLQRKKAKRSQHQSTTLVSHKIPSPVFGHNKDRMSKLAGFMFDADDALVNRYFIYDGGTVERPYEWNTLKKARHYHQRVTNPKNPLLFANRQDFEAAVAKQLDKHNEVLARVRWNVTSSAVGIFNDTFEARCVAQFYAEQTYLRVKAQYKEMGKAWDENYKIPVLYYLPGDDEKNWTRYSEEDRQEDKYLAQSIYENPKKRREKISEGNNEFLLLLDNPKEVWQSLIEDKTHPLLTMINQQQFQLVEALYQRTGQTVPFDEALAAYGIQASTKINHGFNTDILCSAAESNRPGILKFILMLGGKGIEVNKAKDNGATPLYTAAYHGHVDVVKALLEAKDIDVNKAKDNGATPLYTAAYHGHVDVVKALLEDKDIDVNKPMPDGATPLYAAAQNGNIEVVKALLETKDIDVNKPMPDGATPLYVAAQNGNSDVVKALLEAKDIDVNKTMWNGATPLNIAAYNGHIDVVKALLEAKDIEINKTGWVLLTPLNAAKWNNHKHISIYIEQMIKHPENNNNPYKLIQSAFKDYAGYSDNPSTHRFFQRPRNRHHTKPVLNLLQKDTYADIFDETLLRSYLKELSQDIGLQKINSKGDLAGILELTKFLTGIDFKSIIPGDTSAAALYL